jgi:hypothetical protein
VGDGSAEVVSIGVGGTRHIDYSRQACVQVTAARLKLGMDYEEFSGFILRETKRDMLPETIEAWEGGSRPPSDVVMACFAVTQGLPALDVPLLADVPPQFPAGLLAGPWVTVYEFPSMGVARRHADIATITAVGTGRIRAANHPPEPRSEGRSVGFRNEIVADLHGRHLLGCYMNTSDRRYHGVVQLAVHSGETVMEGIYGGVGSDVEVSDGRWKWVRLDAGPAEVTGIVLRDPVELYELVMSRDRNDAPLMLADIGEER